MIEWENILVTELGPNDCFVFGSNEQGFHGAGAAGLACRGDARNNWREDKQFLEWVNSKQLCIGKWAVFGRARGYQQGSCGRSYAIVTVTKPGAKRSITRRQIYAQLVELWGFVKKHFDMTFLIAPLGEGYAGWTREEMDEVWNYLIGKHGLPANVRFIGRKSGVSAT